MERIKKKKIYFIYSQNGEKSNIEKVETNSIVKEVKVVKQEIISNNTYILFCLILNDDYSGKPFALTLIDNHGEFYFSNIFSKTPVKFKYKMLFEHFYNKGSTNSLNQFILPYIEQYNYFKHNLKDDYSLNDLYINSINDLIENKEKNDYEFLLYLFLDIYNAYKTSNNKDYIKTLIKFFKDINFEIFEIQSKTLNIPLEQLQFLYNTHKIRNELISITGNNDEINGKIDAFLGFYYLNFNPKLYILFLEPKNKDFESIKLHLIKYRKLFKDFNGEIMGYDLMMETENLNQIEYLITDFVPNMVEVFKIITNFMIYLKLIAFSQNKRTNILKLCKPQEDDNIIELSRRYDELIDLFIQEKYLPIYIGPEFYIQYSKLFLYKDFEKIELIHKMLNNFNNHVTDKFRIAIDDELDKYYHDTGMYLINKQKLINDELIEFLNNDPYFKNKNKEIPINIIYKGIIFKENEKFMNNFLNNNLPNFDLKEFFGDKYYNFIEYIFATFKIPSELLAIKEWKIESNNINDEVLLIFMNTLKRIWLVDPKNHMYGLEKLISKLFGIFSQRLNNYMDVINELEEKISYKILLSFYSEILYRDYDLSTDFKDHIINYIYDKCNDEDPISIWYKLNTKDNDEMLKNNYLIENLKDEYAVEAKDFIHYPTITNEKIVLFTNLYNAKFFRNEDLRETSYYKKSIQSKDNIFNLKFNEVMIMYKNIYLFLNLFLFFIPGGIYNEENISLIDSLLIDFSDKCGDAKKYYDSLNTIYNYWNQFFSIEKIDEKQMLKNTLTEIEKSSLNDINKIKKETDWFLEFLPEAEEGEKLMKSIFFKAIYESSKVKFNENEERKKYDYCLNEFNKLKKLGDKSDVNSLEEDLRNILTKSIYKEKIRLNDELKFIKTFFNLDKKYNINKIKNDFLFLVKDYQEKNKLGDYVIKIDDAFNDIDEKEKLNNINIPDNIQDDNEKRIQLSKLQILEEKNILINKIHKLADNFLFLLKIYIKVNDNSNDIDINNHKDKMNEVELEEKYINFFSEIFKTNFGFGKLNKEEYMTILNLINKIYINGIDLFNNVKYKKELILISEFIDISESYIRYTNGKLTKEILFELLKNINECYENSNENNYDNIINYFKNLILTIEKNVEGEILNNLMIKLFVKEKRKYEDNNYNKKLNDLIFGTKDLNFIYLYNDLIPYIDELFYDDFNNFIKNKDNNLKNINFNKNMDIINEKCTEMNSFKEMMLFYFETKIIMIFNEIKEEILFSNQGYQDFLELSFKLLEDNLNSKNNSILHILFCIAFIKCFLYKLVDFMHNNLQRSKEANNILDIIKKRNNNIFMKSIKVYILKLIFDKNGNFFDFRNFPFQLHQIEYLTNEEELGDFVNTKKIELETYKKYYGFDFMFIPNKEKSKNEIFGSIINQLLYLKKNSINNNYDDKELLEIINHHNDIDLLYCGLLNVHFSFFYMSDLVINNENNNNNNSEFKNMKDWMIKIIENSEIDSLKNNELLRDLLLLLAKDENYYSYNKILSLSISARFVLNTISNNNKDGLYYKLITNFKNIVEDFPNYFNYYLNEFKETKNQRNVNYLTYKIIRYIILSHLYFGYKLKKINIDDIYKLLNIKRNDNDDDFSSFLCKDFIFIKNNILSLIRINKEIIFMNNIFESISNLLNNIKCCNDDNQIKKEESIIDNEINKNVAEYESNVKEYYKIIESYEEVEKGNIEEDENGNIFLKILYEDNKFFNDKINEPDKKCPYISYLTLTNFCSFDDFKNQYLCFTKGNDTYPMIDSIINNNEICEIIYFIPKLNSLINYFYNELVLKINEDEQNKEISSFIKNKNTKILDDDLINFLNKNKIKISLKSKISEVINIKKNQIFNLYKLIINEYNYFLSHIKIYKENKSRGNAESIIIQSASENDFVTFKTKNKKKDSNNIISAKERLNQIIYLYSKRNRLQDDFLNVYDGGKIIYDYEFIENILQKEFILGKKNFSETQKTFIFSNNVFSDERSDILVNLKNKYPQIEIKEKKNIEEFFNLKNNKEIKELLINIYYDFQYLIIYLMIYDQEEYDCNNIKINYIIKIIEKENYKMSKYTHELMAKYDDFLYICHLISFYEIIELKVFEYLTEGIKEKMKGNLNTLMINQKKEIENILDKNEVKTGLINGIKRYILRYCIGDNKNRNDALEKFNNNFEDLFKKRDIWIDNTQISKEKREKLILINKNNKCVVKYFYNIIFGNGDEDERKIKDKVGEINNKNIEDDNIEDDNIEDDDIKDDNNLYDGVIVRRNTNYSKY